MTIVVQNYDFNLTIVKSQKQKTISITLESIWSKINIRILNRSNLTSLVFLYSQASNIHLFDLKSNITGRKKTYKISPFHRFNLNYIKYHDTHVVFFVIVCIFLYMVTIILLICFLPNFCSFQRQELCFTFNKLNEILSSIS